jgi:hypothetical protein
VSTPTIRLPATKHQRLMDFARARGVSLNKPVEEWATVALAQLDAENKYRPPIGDKESHGLGYRPACRKAHVAIFTSSPNGVERARSPKPTSADVLRNPDFSRP